MGSKVGKRVIVRIWQIGVLAALLFVGIAATQGAGSAQAQEQRLALSSAAATIASAPLREQPASDGAAITTMPVNARSIVLGGPFNADNWYWLDYNGTRGYTQGRFLVTVDERYTPVPLTTPAAGRTSTAGPEATATPDNTIPSTVGTYVGLWIGEMTTGGNVRVGPGLNQKIMKGWWAGRRVLLYQAVNDSKGDVWYRVSDPPEAPMYVHSSLVRKVMAVKYEGARYKGRWININISQQVVTAYEDGAPVKVTLTSTGTGKNLTELGVWKIYYRLPKQDMKGGSLASEDYYFLKDVPYPQYFHTSGEALHGTYWHDDFGRPHSHGCVNLSTPMSEWFYGWAKIGTIVYVHN